MERRRTFMTADEKVYLKELMHKYKGTLESKRTDCISVAERKKAWCALSKEFNSLTENSNRTPEQLKKCWDNIKTRRKRELAEEKKQVMCTGGGPYKSPTENEVDDILNIVDIEVKDTVDSDTLMLSQVKEGEYRITDEQVLEPVSPIVDANEQGNVMTQIETRELVEEENLAQANPTSVLKNKCSVVGITRATALERELQVRLQRNDLLKLHEDEIHALRKEEHQLRVQQEEIKLQQQQIKLEEELVRKKIAEEQLQQEILRTAILKQQFNAKL